MTKNFSEVVKEVFPNSDSSFFSKEFCEIESKDFKVSILTLNNGISLFFDRFSEDKKSELRNLGIKFSKQLIKENVRLGEVLIVFDNRMKGSNAETLFTTRLKKTEVFQTSIHQKVLNIKEFFGA